MLISKTTHFFRTNDKMKQQFHKDKNTDKYYQVGKKMQKNYEQVQRFIDTLAEHILFSKKSFIFNFWEY